MMKLMCGVTVLAVSLSVFAAYADPTVAYWRFEEGPAGAQVSHPVADGVYYEAALDSSGNGYGLSVWNEGGAGYRYNSEVGGPVVSGAVNNFSVKNSGGGPAMWTDPADGINSITPSAFTIEATFKLENGGWRTIVGRDSRGTATTNGDLAAMYFQATPGNHLAIKFCDVQGYWHEAVSASNAFTGFDWGPNPDGIGVPWYSMAAVSDGSILSLYLRNVTDGGAWTLIAQTDIAASGSSNTAMHAGAGSGGDWQAGNWTVGRGMYAGGHGDRAYGFIDEVRISEAALSTSQFLMVVPEPMTLVLLGLGGLGLLKRRS
jgi:hypothetical protein